ncbi:chemotaxis protein, partial [Pantoea sp. SIMBA_072]
AVQTDELNTLGNRLVSQLRGGRLADLALNMIDIMDRNLYERSCDVRWWATDSAVVDCATAPSEANRRQAVQRLGVILGAYTVYLDL